MATKKQNKEEQLVLESVFGFFIEIGIIHQLSSTALNRRLPQGMHVSHFSVLNHLVRLGNGQTPVEIARAFQVTKGTMTHTLSELEKRELITLLPNPDDRRSKHVHITSEGTLFRDNAIASLAPYIASLSSVLDIDAIKTMTSMLQNVRTILDNNRDAD
ncbi:MAG: MarR family transcriptional regulator [Gammaproteobacteria bacterium]|nr:MarR family transcriptional regulator [Gammaproteobacteria bacterium]